MKKTKLKVDQARDQNDKDSSLVSPPQPANKIPKKREIKSKQKGNLRSRKVVKGQFDDSLKDDADLKNELDPNEAQSGEEDSKDSTYKIEGSSLGDSQKELSDQDIEIIERLSPKFEITFKELKSKDPTYFKGKTKEEIAKIKTWYKYRHRKYLAKVSSSFDTLFPKVDNPNEVLKRLLNSEIEESERNYIAKILEEGLPTNVKRHYTNKYLNEILRDFKQASLQEMKEILLELPLSLRLKAVAKAICMSKKKGKGEFDQNLKISWFNMCIRPALKASINLNYYEFDQEEIREIASICIFNGPGVLQDEEAFTYVKLIKQGKILNVDQLYQYYYDRCDSFWLQVFKNVLKIEDDIANIWVKHKESMITQALCDYYSKYSMDSEFANQLSLFQKLSAENLKDVGLLRQRPNFSIIIKLLDQSKLHDFNLFKQQAETYLKMENAEQIKAFQQTLKDVALSKWLDYKNIIMATENFIKEDESLKITKDVLQRVMKLENLRAYSDDTQKKLEDVYQDAFQHLNSKIILRQFQWQKELVTFLAYLILFKSKRNILITLGTGHGKSVVIQLLADMIQQIQGNVNVVTLNRFLAYWGRKNYSHTNEKIAYIELEHLLKKAPIATTHVIYDEIDQMLGANSFRLIDEGDQVTACYVPSIMKKWKSLIGFSGTISQATLDQLRMELKDPICIEIPSLRKMGVTNSLSKVIKVEREQRSFAILNRIKDESSRYKNFIIIMKDEKDAYDLLKNKEFKVVASDRIVVDFIDFNRDYSDIEQKLKMLTKDNFIIVTVPEGGRGVDYKGLSVAHVIITYDPQSLSEVQQCIGRGVREISTYTEGTIIGENPPTLDAGEYLAMIESKDAEKAEGMEMNCKVARMLNSQSHKKSALLDFSKISSNSDNDPHFTMIYFRSFMERGSNFLTSEDGSVLWKFIKMIDSSGTMPSDPYQDWNY